MALLRIIPHPGEVHRVAGRRSIKNGLACNHRCDGIRTLTRPGLHVQLRSQQLRCHVERRITRLLLAAPDILLAQDTHGLLAGIHEQVADIDPATGKGGQRLIKHGFLFAIGFGAGRPVPPETDGQCTAAWGRCVVDIEHLRFTRAHLEVATENTVVDIRVDDYAIRWHERIRNKVSEAAEPPRTHDLADLIGLAWDELLRKHQGAAVPGIGRHRLQGLADGEGGSPLPQHEGKRVAAQVGEAIHGLEDLCLAAFTVQERTGEDLACILRVVDHEVADLVLNRRIRVGRNQIPTRLGRLDHGIGTLASEEQIEASGLEHRRARTRTDILHTQQPAIRTIQLEGPVVVVIRVFEYRLSGLLHLRLGRFGCWHILEVDSCRTMGRDAVFELEIHRPGVRILGWVARVSQTDRDASVTACGEEHAAHLFDIIGVGNQAPRRDGLRRRASPREGNDLGLAERSIIGSGNVECHLEFFTRIQEVGDALLNHELGHDR
ncbi:hypothetical protein D3C72_1128510 [compost metagenome]